MRTILGLNAYHGDSAAALYADGRLVAAVEEERLNRVKHWAGFPSLSIRCCLDLAGITVDAIDAISVNRDPWRDYGRKVLHVLRHRPKLGALFSRLSNHRRLRRLNSEMSNEFGARSAALNIIRIEHHEAHLASAFLVSPYEKAAVLSIDGFGDFSSIAMGLGEGRSIKVLKRVRFPHSLGLFYTAMTQYLGFPRYGDEYKIMGLAGYGEPLLKEKLRETIRIGEDGDFQLDLRFFLHHLGKVSMGWDNCEPSMGTVYSRELESLLGPARREDENLTDRHRAVAASAQELYEEAFFNILMELNRITKQDTLCLAGGCALNSLANGKIFERSPFKRVYVQPAAGDAGGAVGAAAWVQHVLDGRPRGFVMRHAYWGSEFTEREIHDVISNSPALRLRLDRGNARITRMDEESLIDKTVGEIQQGSIVGWFQGRSEWGPRALGNRSILVDPRRPDMKAILNTKIKRRESFRPFAPAILRERVSEFFETDADVPFMQQVFRIRPEKRGMLPAVTHVDGTGRLQTVTEEQNRLFHRLIRQFGERTGVPILLNTSFNENEPIVNRPDEALDCFLRTEMDILVMGPYVLERAR